MIYVSGKFECYISDADGEYVFTSMGGGDEVQHYITVKEEGMCVSATILTSRPESRNEYLAMRKIIRTDVLIRAAVC